MLVIMHLWKVLNKYYLKILLYGDGNRARCDIVFLDKSNLEKVSR